MQNKFFLYSLQEEVGYSEDKLNQLLLLKCILDKKDRYNKAKWQYVIHLFKAYYLSLERNYDIKNKTLIKYIQQIKTYSLIEIWNLLKDSTYSYLYQMECVDISIDNNDMYLMIAPQLLQEDNLYQTIDRQLKVYTIYLVNEKDTGKDKKARIKKVVTPLDKLTKKIRREFPKKKLVGDINITDEEYELLKQYFCKKCNTLINSSSHLIIDPIFATALVQIGIKNYDGNFWGHVGDVLQISHLRSNWQTWIGESFLSTLQRYNKLALESNEKVNNILMHGLVSDHYSNDLFEFLFAYYRIDLERDLTNNSSEMMKHLVDTMIRNDNTGRTYLVVKQTSDALKLNTRGGKIKLRRLLKLIDQCFWEQITPSNSVNRLSILFNKWQEESEKFQGERNEYNAGGYGRKAEKKYNSPYLKCNLKNNTFSLELPMQLLKEEQTEGLYWKITHNEQEELIDVDYYEGVVGYKTECRSIMIEGKHIFELFNVQLFTQNEKIKSFKIKADSIRFFDKEGDFVRTECLSEGEFFSYTQLEHKVQSNAIIEQDKIGRLERTYFDFQQGDIIKLPNKQAIAIGEKIQEGLMTRNQVPHAYIELEDQYVDIYKVPPNVLIKMESNKVNGTMIVVNNDRYRLSEMPFIEIELKEGTNEKGYMLDLRQYGCEEDGLYNIWIDVPNDRTNRLWQFALLKSLKYNYEDAPYIFQRRGTINIECQQFIECLSKNINRIPRTNTYNFEITERDDQLEFNVKIKEDSLKLFIDIPSVKWKFDEDEWQIEKPDPIWYTKFPMSIYLKTPYDRVGLRMEEVREDEDCIKYYNKLKNSNAIECDVTPFRSWLGREQNNHKLQIILGERYIEFLDIVTSSIVHSSMIQGDYKAGVIMGKFDIVGEANYYVDIEYDGDKLFEKIPVRDGEFKIQTTVKSGVYYITLFEDEYDDTGFGEAQFYKIGTYKKELLNPWDLEGKNLVIRHIKAVDSTCFSISLSCRYKVNHLKPEANNKFIYYGTMAINDEVSGKVSFIEVKVQFIDFNNLSLAKIEFKEDEEYIPFGTIKV